VIAYRLVAEPRADLDVAATFDWYENEEPALGQDFLNELRAAYDRIADGPLAYQDLRSGIRRGLLRRFSYAAYFGSPLKRRPRNQPPNVARVPRVCSRPGARRLC
jgi:plasmid stabilization system protein ParE